MDCREVLEFRDDSSRVAERTKESILLMKKKMLRSHDLILQYNNKMKECDCLKGDLCAAQEEMARAKRESGSYRTKIVKLESQVADYKNNVLNLENKIADQDIKIASDKCHLEQLICKLEGIEDKHSGMLIEADVKKSSLEGKIKELEQELRKLKKAQLAENSEKSAKPQRGKRLLAKKDTIDIGVNTTDEKGLFSKSSFTDKSISTDEFYHIKDNPYPIFCHQCEVPIKPSIEKFCEIMTTHPPLLGKMSSPPPRRVLGSPEFGKNSNDPEAFIVNKSRECHANPLEKLTPEVEGLKEKIAALERKMKRRKRQTARELPHPNGSCCGHSCTANRFPPHGSTPPNIPTDFMADFWNRIINFTKESTRKVDDKRTRDRIGRKKLSKLNKRKTKMPPKGKRDKCVSSTNWDVESDEGEASISVESCTQKSNILRRDRSTVRSSSLDPDEFSEKEVRTRDDIERDSAGNSKSNFRSRSREKSNVSFDDHEPRKKRICEKTIIPEKRRSSSRIHERTLRNREAEGKMNSSRHVLFSEFADRDEESPMTPTRSIDSSPMQSRHVGRARRLRNSESNMEVSEERVAATINRSISCSPSYDLADRQKTSTERNGIYDSDTDPDDSALNDFSSRQIGKSGSNLFNEDSNDPSGDNNSDDETSRPLLSHLAGGNSRKRKRSASPMKSAKRSVKSKLLGKLRALKKNSKIIPTKGPRNPIVEDAMPETGKTVDESNTEDPTSNVKILPKKQRIAHVPKKSLSKEREIPRETRSSSDKKESSSIIKSRDIDDNTRENSNKISANNRSALDDPDEHRSPYKVPNDCKITENSRSLENAVRKILQSQDIHDENRDECRKDHVENISKIVSIESTEIIDENRVEGQKMVQALQEKAESSALSPASKLPYLQSPPLPEFTASNVSDSTKGDSENKEEFAPCLENIRCGIDFYRDTIGSTIDESSAETQKNVENDRSRDNSILSRSDETLTKKVLQSVEDGTSGLIDESPASPDNSHTAHLSDSDLAKSPKKISVNRLSIYENALSSASSANNQLAEPVNDRGNLSTFDYSQNSSGSHSAFDESEHSRDNEPSREASTLKFQNIVRELRTRQVLSSPASKNSSQRNPEKTKCQPVENFDETSEMTGFAASQRGIRSLDTLLGRHLALAKKKSGTKAQRLRKAAAVKLQAEAEKTVRDELAKLVECEEWTMDIHANVIATLSQVSSQRTISKCIVDFLVERADIGEPLDRTHTPPAPVMTRTQQRIAALINGLERDPSMSGVFELVRAGINFNLFRLGYAIQVELIEPLVRMLTAMARMKKDREGARVLCCNAFYFLGRRATNAIQVVLSIWPEVLPMHGSREDALVNCFVHLIRMEQSPKATSLKIMLREYYKYPECQMQSTVLMDSLINAMKEKYTGELEVAILLIAKREGTEWAYKNIIKNRLLNIIDDNDYPSLSNALSLLGFILRTFPVEDEDKTIASMVTKLCTMLESTHDSPDKEEGIISALLSLSRFNLYFDRIADSIFSWKPSKAIRACTIEQLNSFFKARPSDWWNKRKRERMNPK